MKAEIITIGDEILIGQIVDTNSAWIAARLNEAGIRVTGRVSVGDQAEEIADAVDRAMRRAEVVVVTGGLGPTRDDITKQVLADIFGGGMREDAATLESVGEMLRRRGVDFNALNRSQAVVPAAARLLPNPNGTAPGMWFEKEGRILVSLPGVPFEMKPLMTDQVLPQLRGRFDLKRIIHRTMITHGIAESMLAERIAPWEDALPAGLSLAYLPAPSGVRLRLSAYEADGEMEAVVAERFATLEKIIPGNVIGYESENLESTVAKMLTARGLTLSVAESCTGGHISAMFTSMPGASEYFLGGVTAYSNDVKADALGVRREDIEEYGAVSETVARQMAEGVRRITGSDYALATTGIAGPSGGSAEKPVGTVWIALASAAGTTARLFAFGNLREQNIPRASAMAVDMLRRALTE